PDDRPPRAGLARGGAHPLHARGDEPRRSAGRAKRQPRVRLPGEARRRLVRLPRRGGREGTARGTRWSETMTEGPNRFATIDEAAAEMRAGRMVILVDDEDRENEGDLTLAAEQATPEAINFMVRHARGLVCLALEAERCDALGLPQQSEDNTSQFGTAFTVS